MKKLLVIQIILLLIFSGSFFLTLFSSDIYNDIKSTIVDQTCFSCIKMDPISKFEFIFDTVDDKPHPQFVLDNITKGPIFLAFRADICTACDIMEPVLMDLFNVEFGKKEIFYQIINYSNTNIVFYHININPPYEIETESFYIYDKDKRSGVPMFVLITLGDNNGTIQPYYITSYSTLGLDNNLQRRDYFEDVLKKGIEFYKNNIDKYKNQNN